jgi:List-Bact-rpt repeat protein
VKRLLALGALLVAITVAAPASARLAHYPVNVSVTGSGTVTGQDPDGNKINCPPKCSALMKQNTNITLNANPAEGWTFVGWGGECSGTGSCTFNHMDGASVSVSATFDNPGPFNLTVSGVGNGSGSVSGGPISCPSTCSASVAKGTTVNLTATPSSPSTFEGWGGPCSGTGGCSVTMDSAKTVTAQFSLPAVPTYLLTVSKAGSGTGTVTGGGIDCGVTCASSVPQGSTITLTAAPGDGSTFVGWGGPCTGTGVCTVTMNAATSVTATFDLTTTTSPPPPPPPPPPPGAIKLTVQKVGAGSGYVGGAGGIDCGPSCSIDVLPGTNIALVASAAAGSRFVRWNSAACGTSPACSVTVTEPTTLMARFDKARDTSRPSVKVFKARAKKGALARLRYRTADRGGGTLRLNATVLSGSRVLSQLAQRRARAGGRSAFGWRVPLRPPPRLQFCIRARDAAGNLSRKVCAPILVG